MASWPGPHCTCLVASHVVTACFPQMVFKKFKTRNLIRLLTKCHSLRSPAVAALSTLQKDGMCLARQQGLLETGRAGDRPRARPLRHPGGTLPGGRFVGGSFVQHIAGQGRRAALSPCTPRPRGAGLGVKADLPWASQEEGSGRGDAGAKAAEKFCVAEGSRPCRHAFFQRFAEPPGKVP